MFDKLESNIVFDITEKFLVTENLDEAIKNLIAESCDYFEIDRVVSGTRKTSKDICIPVAIYERDNGYIINNSVDIQSNKKSEYSVEEINEAEEKFIELCSEKIHFIGKECEKKMNLLNILGYGLISSNDKMPAECIIACIKIKEFFSYIVAEKYNEDNIFDEDTLRYFLNTFHIMRLRIEKDLNEKNLSNAVKIQQSILKNEGIPICVVHKDTKEILEYNERYEEILPHIKKCKYYYELIGKTKEFSIEDNINTKYVEIDSEHWVRKNTEFTLNDGQEVYIIYGKNTKDHIKQLEGLDLLTSSLSLKGLESYYNMIIRNDNYNEYILLTLDVAKFKNINSRCGFEKGNLLLTKIANALDNSLIEEEMFCRINDDKFAIIFRQDDEETSATRFTQLECNFMEIKNYDSCFNNLDIHIGVCLIDKNIDFNILIDRANMARKSIKNSSEQHIAFYDESIEDIMQREIYIEERQQYALDNNEYHLYLQPKFDIKTNTICGAEALVRWVTYDGEVIYPNEFIPLFERNGFVCKLDFLIYEKVLKYLRYCLNNNLPTYPISMNVSRNHISNVDFVSDLWNLIELYDIPVNLVELEITEGVFLENANILVKFIDELKTCGIKISIDDFGTAYSSLNLLADINIDILKIDKSFLVNLSNKTPKKSKLLLKNIIRLAKDLELKVICEGVETEEQLEILKSMDCELGQGYLFAKPMPIGEYSKLFIEI